MAKAIEPWEITAWALGELEPNRQVEVGVWLAEHPEELAEAERARGEAERMLGEMADDGTSGRDSGLDLGDRRLARLAEEVERMGRRGTGVAGQLARWRSWGWGDVANSWNLHWGLAAALLVMASLAGLVLVMIWQGLGGTPGGQGTGGGGMAARPGAGAESAAGGLGGDDVGARWHQVWARHADRLPPQFDAGRSLWPAVEPATANLAEALRGLGAVKAFGWSEAEGEVSGVGARLKWEHGAASVAAVAREQAWRSGAELSLPAAYATWDVAEIGESDRSELVARGDWSAGLKRVSLEGAGGREMLVLEVERVVEAGQDREPSSRERLSVLLVVGQQPDSEAWAAFCRAVAAIGSLVVGEGQPDRIEIAVVNGSRGGWIAHPELSVDFEMTYDRLMDLTPVRTEARSLVVEQWLGRQRASEDADVAVRRVVFGTDQSGVESVLKGLGSREKPSVGAWWPGHGTGVTKSSNFEARVGVHVDSRQGRMGSRWFGVADREPIEEVVLDLCDRPSAPALLSGWELELRFAPGSLVRIPVSDGSGQAISLSEFPESGRGVAGASQDIEAGRYTPATVGRTKHGWIIALRIEAAGDRPGEESSVSPSGSGAADSEPVSVTLRPSGVSAGADERGLVWSLEARRVEAGKLSDAERWLVGMAAGTAWLSQEGELLQIDAVEAWMGRLLDLCVDLPVVRRQAALGAQQIIRGLADRWPEK